MKLAVYSRKSKFTSKGESIENQIQLCREYISIHFGTSSETDIVIYEDEGYSGGNTDRPQFQQMICDARLKKFDILVCYRLDRISRNVSDFSTLIDEFSKYSIGFISIREQFDTTTPMGRAMMYIASVFSQLERETIAERIRDNMIQLAKTGRWLGGNTPLGFSSKEITFSDNGKNRKLYALQTEKNESEIVKLIYSKYLELNSLTKLETYLIQIGTKSKQNKFFNRWSLRAILSNPVYAKADGLIYDYFKNNEYEIYSEMEAFDGIHGVMAYNKTIQKPHASIKQRDHAEWIIAVGKHHGLIESRNWIRVQSLLEQNKSKGFRKVKNSDSLLSGILKCAVCGSYMRPRTASRYDENGDQKYYYMCELKEKSGRKLCNVKNAYGNDLDSLVLNELKSLSKKGSGLSSKIDAEAQNMEYKSDNILTEIEKLELAVTKNRTAIDNLLNNLADASNSPANKYLVDKINELDKINAEHKDRIYLLKSQKETTELDQEAITIMENLLINFSSSVDTLDVLEKRNLIKSLVDSVTWDGNNIDINLFGSKKKFPQRVDSKRNTYVLPQPEKIFAGCLYE